MNIIKSLQTQLKQGKRYIDSYGNVISDEKIMKDIKKQYANGIKSQEINPEEISFNNYFEMVTYNYLTVNELISYITGTEQEQKLPFEPDEILEDNEGWCNLLTVSEVAKKLGYSPTQIRNLIREGKLKAYKFSSSYRVNEDDLQEFINKSIIKKENENE